MTLKREIMFALSNAEANKFLKTISKAWKGIPYPILRSSIPSKKSVKEILDTILELWEEGKLMIWEISFSGLSLEEREHMRTLLKDPKAVYMLAVSKIKR